MQEVYNYIILGLWNAIKRLSRIDSTWYWQLDECFKKKDYCEKIE